jgi:hypothetical protein
MNPTPGDLHVNAPLTNVSVAYMQRDQDFIASRAFPNVPVAYQGNMYRTYDKADWSRIEAQERAPATESAGGGWRIGSDTYFARVYAIHKDIDDQTRANTDPDINLDRDATNYVTRQLLLKREKLWADTFFKTGVWGTEYAGVASGPSGAQFLRWDNANATPITDITNLGIAMAQTTGYRPNRLVLSPQVYNSLANHATLLDRIKYTQRGMVTADMMAALFGVDEVLVPWGVVNTAPEGASGSYSFIFGKHALLLYSAPNPSPMEASAGYIFSWTGYLGAGQQGNRVKRFRMEQIASDRVEGEMAFDMKVVASDVGVFFSDAIS